MASLGVFDTVLVYNFIKRLTLPFNKWDAFKQGVINDKGDIILPPKERNPQQKKSFKVYDLMLLKLKKLLAKIPGGGSRFATFSAALFLILEDLDNKDYNLEKLEENFLKFYEEENFIELNEVTNSTSTTIQYDAPPVRNVSFQKVGNCTTFDVDFDKVWKSRLGKHPRHRYSKYIGEDEVGQQIRDYCKKNLKRTIALRNTKDGQILFLKYNGFK